MKRICPQCSTEFSVPQRKPSQIFCRRACWRAALSRQVAVTCETCGKVFTTYQARAARTKHCSIACRRNQITKVCPICDSTFSVKASQADKRSTCSRHCARLLQHRAPSYWQDKARTPDTKARVATGLRTFYAGHPEKHWNFKGGQFSDRRGITASWVAQKLLARARDAYTCQVCGITEQTLGKKLAVHHIQPYRTFATSTAANVLSNLTCLCQSCHMRIEHGTAVLENATDDQLARLA